MDTYICSRCKKEMKECDKNNHELYCAYLPKKEEMQDLIPCEYCNCLIHFDQYISCFHYFELIYYLK